GPLSEAAVTPAIHPHLSVAPGLSTDPIDHCAGILAVVFIRYGHIRAASLAAAVRHHSGVTVSGCPSRFGEVLDIVGIDGEREEGWKRCLHRFRPRHYRGDMSSVWSLDKNVFVNDVASCIVLGNQDIGRRHPSLNGMVEIILSNQIHG